MFKVKILATACAAALAGPALAQQVSPHEDGAKLEEIVVTAQRRSENLQNVPIAVSAFTPALLAEKIITNTRDLQQATPSMSVGNQFGASTSAVINLRGQVQDVSAITVDPSVGVYQDDIYLGRVNGQLAELFDIERIEVLKGPQGTLYGRNTTGGALRIITNKANPEGRVSGYATAAYGTYNDLRLEAGANLPIIPNIMALRLSMLHHSHSGYTKSYITDGGGVGRAAALTGRVVDSDDRHWNAGRGDLAWNVNDEFRLSVSADYTEDRSNGILSRNRLGDVITGNALSATGRTVTNSPEAQNDFWSGRVSEVPYANLRQWGVGGTALYTLGATTAKLVLAHRYVDAHQRVDTDGTDQYLLSFEYALTDKQNSAEFQLNGTAMDDRLHWLYGLFYFKESGTETTLSNAAYGASSRIFGVGATNRSYSAFTHLEYDITGQLTATLGYRYTWDRKDIRGFSRAGGLCAYVPGTPGLVQTSSTNCTLFKGSKANFPSWTAGLSYHIKRDILTYAKTSRASRSGGQQARGIGFIPSTALDTNTPFQPETVTDVEVGLKAELFDRALRLNIDAYHSWLSSAQKGIIVTTPGVGSLSLVANLPGTTKIKGMEIESTAVIDRFTWDFAGSFTEGEPSDPRFVMSLTPKYKVSTTLAYKQPTSFGSITGSVTYSYSSSQYVLTEATFRQLTQFDSRNIVNAQLRAELNNEVSISLWGKNIFEDKYWNHGAAFAPFGYPIAPSFVGEPRTVGATVTTRF